MPFILGTLWITGVAILLAVPMSLLTSVYLSEYAPVWVRKTVRPVIDVLAGIPSVVFGVWGPVGDHSLDSRSAGPRPWA